MGNIRAGALALACGVALMGMAVADSAPALATETSVFLPVEPLRDLRAPVSEHAATDARAAMADLRAAAGGRDLRELDAALGRANELIETLPLGAERNALRHVISTATDIQQLWQYAESDRFGAFFDDEALPGLHDHLATDYAGLAAYLDEQSVVDAHGRALYPTAEAKTFLLRQLGADGASEPATAPARVRIARASRVTPPRAHIAAATPIVAANVAKSANAATTSNASTSGNAATTGNSATTANAAPLPETVPVPKPLPVADALVNDMRNAAAPPQSEIVVPAPAAAKPLQANVVDSTTDGTSVFFIIIALAAVGVLTTLMRLPDDAAIATSVFPAPTADAAHADLHDEKSQSNARIA